MSKSLLCNNRICFICGTTFNLHKHHIFGGANRKKSEKDGCWCYLCASDHNMSDRGVHFNRQADLNLKRVCQTAWMMTYNKTIDDFIREYGRSYL